MSAEDPGRRGIARGALAVALLLAAGCTRPEPLQPGTFTAMVGGARRAEYKGVAEFCPSPGGGGSLSFISRPDAVGFMLHGSRLDPGVARAVDRADLHLQPADGFIAEVYVPDSLMAEPYVRSGSVRIGHVDSARVEGNFALTLVPREDAQAKRVERGLTFRVAFQARPRRNC